MPGGLLHLDNSEHIAAIGYVHKHRPFEEEYDLGDAIGTGGFAVVRKAVHRATGVTYAVKTLRVKPGGAGGDVLRGGDDSDQIDGGAGVDFVCGGSGDDRLLGGAGLDLIQGGLGNDHLDGGAGTDVRWGGPGDDQLQGGAGTDFILGEAGDDQMDGLEPRQVANLASRLCAR